MESKGHCDLALEIRKRRDKNQLRFLWVMCCFILGSSESLLRQLKVSKEESSRNVSQAVEQGQENQCRI